MFLCCYVLNVSFLSSSKTLKPFIYLFFFFNENFNSLFGILGYSIA